MAAMQNIEGLVEILNNGGIIIYPTDTIWGVGCDAMNTEAIEKVYDVKQRPEQKSVIVLFSSEEMLIQHGFAFSEEQKKFLDAAERPTTMVVKGVKGLSLHVYHDDGVNTYNENDFVSVRIVRATENNPGATACHALIEAFGKPIVSTSANISGEDSPLNFAMISQQVINAVDGYLDPTIADTNGKPSQIVRMENDGSITILRA